MIKRLAVLLLLPLTLGLVGCGSSEKIGQYDVTVSLAEDMRSEQTGRFPSLEVDIVGIGPTQDARWRKHPVSQYFSGSDDLRQGSVDDRTTLRFTNDNPAPKTLERTDPIWDRWSEQGATQMFVLVNLPRIVSDLEGEADPRRLILPLDRARWGSKQIQIEIRPGEVICLTPVRPPAE